MQKHRVLHKAGKGHWQHLFISNHKCFANAKNCSIDEPDLLEVVEEIASIGHSLDKAGHKMIKGATIIPLHCANTGHHLDSEQG